MRVEEIIDKKLYQELWKENKLSILQSWNWGIVKSKTWLTKRFRLQSENIDIVFTMFIRKYPIINKYFAYIPKIFNDEIINQIDIEQLSTKLLELNNIEFIIYEPNVKVNTCIKKHNKILHINKSVQPKYTNIISLSENIENIFTKLTKDTRYEIRKAIKNGCSVFESSKLNDFDNFMKIMKSIYIRTKYIMFGYDYFVNILNELSKDKLCTILYVKHKDEIVGAMMHFCDESTEYEMYGGVNDKGRRLSANYLLKWEGIKYAIEHKKIYFDQWGVAPINNGEFDKKHEMYKISKFKSCFNGENIEFIGQFVYVKSNIWYNIYKIGRFLNQIVINLRKTLK